MGRIIETSVLVCVLYGAEVRAYSKHVICRYSVFLNRITRYICWDPDSRGLMKMEGRDTQTDLCLKCGLRSVSEYVARRQLAYVGHLEATTAGHNLSHNEHLSEGQPNGAHFCHAS